MGAGAAACVLLALAGVAEPARAAPPPTWASTSEIAEFVEGRFEALRLPGLAVVVLAEGSVVYEGAFGEAAPGVPVTLDTPFRLGSTSKQFTGLAIQQLSDRGQLTLETRVGSVLPELADAPGWELTTVADLLSHRSGLSTRAGLDFWGPLASPATLTAEVARLRTIPLSHPSGEFYEYSNANYSLLGAIVERITGAGYAAALDELVLDPLGLASTTADPGPGPQQGIAATYYPWFQQVNAVTPAPAVGEVGVPSAYIASSARDLTRLLQAQLGTPTGVESRVLAASREPLGTVDEYSRYASGWIVRPMWEIADADEGWDDPDRPLLWEHQGDALRAQSSLAFVPEIGLGVVAVTNTGPGTDQAVWSRFLYELNHLVVGSAPAPWDEDLLVRAVPALLVGVPLLQFATLGWLALARDRSRRRWLPWTIGGVLTTTVLVLALVVVPDRTEQSLLDLTWMVAVPDLAVSVGVMLLGAVCYLALAIRRLVRPAGSR